MFPGMLEGEGEGAMKVRVLVGLSLGALKVITDAQMKQVRVR